MTDWLALSPALIIVLIFAGLYFMGRKEIRRRRQLAARRRVATPSRATIIESEVKAYSHGDGKAVTHGASLTLEVETHNGPVRTRVRWGVSNMLDFDRLRPGCQLDILVDRSDPTLVWTNESWLSEPPSGNPLRAAT